MSRTRVFPSTSGGCVKIDEKTAFALHVLPGPVSGVPVTMSGDPTRIVGFASVFPDGQASIAIQQSSDPLTGQVASLPGQVQLSYQIVRAHQSDGMLVVEELYPISIAISRDAYLSLMMRDRPEVQVYVSGSCGISQHGDCDGTSRNNADGRCACRCHK